MGNQEDDEKILLIKGLISDEKITEAIDKCGENIKLLLLTLDTICPSKPDNCLILAQEILRLDPQNANAHETCGRIYVRLRKYSDAESEFHQASRNA